MRRKTHKPLSFAHRHSSEHARLYYVNVAVTKLTLESMEDYTARFRAEARATAERFASLIHARTGRTTDVFPYFDSHIVRVFENDC
jgi:hypothetical protein